MIIYTRQSERRMNGERTSSEKQNQKESLFTDILCVDCFVAASDVWVYLDFLLQPVCFSHAPFEGGAVSLLLYYLIYTRLVRIYRADKVAQYSIRETVFSQILAFGITDLILYVECCLIARRYVSILPVYSR